MDKVFRVELTGGNQRCCELALPATDYELLDALERLQLKPGDQPKWEIIEHTKFWFLHVHLIGECDLYQLNALATRLGQMSSRDRIAFEGLFNMEMNKKYGPISIATMVDLAYSTDCCHVVEGACTDEQLGRFYAENGFMPELDELPKEIYQLLNFSKLGEKMRLEDGGILVGHGYVSQHTDLKHVYDTLRLVPIQPDYAFRLLIGSEANSYPEKWVSLTLPATSREMVDVLNGCGATSWDEILFQAEDSIVPHILEEMDCDSVEEINKLAQQLQVLDEQGQMPKYKAVLQATHCEDLNTAMMLAETLDAYQFEAEMRTPEEFVRSELNVILCPKDAERVYRHLDHDAYARELLTQQNAEITPYGTVNRADFSLLREPKTHTGFELNY